jgi:hypothetical protein
MEVRVSAISSPRMGVKADISGTTLHMEKQDNPVPINVVE